MDAMTENEAVTEKKAVTGNQAVTENRAVTQREAVPEYADKEIVSKISNHVLTPAAYSEV